MSFSFPLCVSETIFTFSESALTTPTETPQPLGVHLLVRGNLSEEMLFQIQTLWNRSAEKKSFFNPIFTSPQMPLSPIAPSSPLVETSADYTYLEIKPYGSGMSYPYVVTRINRLEFYPKTEEPIAIIKLRQTEVGSARWKRIYNKEIPFPRIGCPPGSGAFIELLAGMYLRNLLKLLPEVADRCIIPRIAYAQMGHPSFSSKLAEVRSGHLPSVLGTGIIEEFIPGCKPISEELLETVDNPLLIELLAVLHTLILHNDGTIFNVLMKDNALVLIDNGYSLSQRGIDGGKFFWLKNSTLQNPPSERIQKFIKDIDEKSLETLAEKLHEELVKNGRDLSKEEEDLSNLKMDRILPHKITLCFMKKAVKQNWSLSRIASTLLYSNHGPNSPKNSNTCLVNRIYEELTANELPPEILKQKMEELCAKAIAL